MADPGASEPALILRLATQDDLAQVVQLYRHLIPEEEPCTLSTAQASFAQLAQWPGSGIIVAERDGPILASCTLVVIPNLTRGGKPYGLIENVVTHADARRTGLGRQVLHFATEQAWDAGCYKVMLLTGADRPDNHAFYAAAGFEQSKTGFQIRRHPKRA